MHRIAERSAARLSIAVLALVIAMGAAVCLRTHRAAALQAEAREAAGAPRGPPPTVPAAARR